MAAKKPRLNITFEPATVAILTALATQADKSVASFTKELVLEALDRYEDMALSALAEEREPPGQQTYTHDEFWQ